VPALVPRVAGVLLSVINTPLEVHNNDAPTPINIDDMITLVHDGDNMLLPIHNTYPKDPSVHANPAPTLRTIAIYYHHTYIPSARKGNEDVNNQANSYLIYLVRGWLQFRR
jgi:hypothetical protein